jgi:hypothetical protein
MNNSALFIVGIVVAILGIVLGVFFLIPGVNHIIVDSAVHTKHALACFVLAVLGIVLALVNRPKTASK